MEKAGVDVEKLLAGGVRQRGTRCNELRIRNSER
jgi:hypothetical protein